MPLRTYSSPGCVAVAAGSPSSCDHRGVAPNLSYSAASNSTLLRWRLPSSHYQQRYHCRYCQRRRSCRNDRSLTETVIESSGGPWLRMRRSRRKRAVVDGRDEGSAGEMDVQKGTEATLPLHTASATLSIRLVTADDHCSLRHLKLPFK